MRKLIVSIAAVAVFAIGMTGTGDAADAPRLDGTFKVVATVKANDFGIAPGTKAQETYKFKSTCPSGSCKKVKLLRTDNGGTYKSTLKSAGSGVYEGTEGPYPYPSCLDNGAATFTADHKIKVTDSDHGDATKISGTTNVQVAGCTSFSFVDYKLRGTPK